MQAILLLAAMSCGADDEKVMTKEGEVDAWRVKVMVDIAGERCRPFIDDYGMLAIAALRVCDEGDQIGKLLDWYEHPDGLKKLLYPSAFLRHALTVERQQGETVSRHARPMIRWAIRTPILADKDAYRFLVDSPIQRHDDRGFE